MSDIPWFIQSQQKFGLTLPINVSHVSFSRHFPLHRHDFIEIEYVVSGKGKETVNGIEYDLRQGVTSLLLPWHSHEITPDPNEPIEIYKCSFGAEYFMSSYAFVKLGDVIFNDIMLPPVAELEPETNNKVRELFNEILQESEKHNLWKTTLMMSKVEEILVYFDRCRKAAMQNDDKTQSEFSIWEVMEFIHSFYSKDIDLKFVAEKFHYSESNLNKLLKKHFALNFADILQEVRIRNACTMLAYPIITVNEVAENVGYKSKSSFYRAFRAVKGMSPDNYRKNYLSTMGSPNKTMLLSVLNSQIIYYLHMHFNENVTLASLAKEFHYTESYLSELLAQNGFNFVSLLHEIRIYHACSLLLTTETAINDIGFDVGFNSTETFFRVFKKLRGISPGEYRKRAAY